MAADPRLARRQQAAARAASTNTPPPPPPPPAQSSTPLPSKPPPSAFPISTTPQPQSQEQSQQQNDAKESYKLKFCTVCASNNNRSMESHLRLSNSSKHYPVISFGTGSSVRLPGPTQYQPNVYSFNSTTYEQMYNELAEKDTRLYSSNGILKMLARNKDIKSYPERWQDWHVGEPRYTGGHENDQGFVGTEGGIVDVVITCEERCWDSVVDDLLTRGAPLNRPVHVFNVDIKDSHEEALKGGRAILDLADSLNEAAAEQRASGKSTAGWESGQGDARQGFDDRVPDILGAWQERFPEFPALWTMAWF